MTNTELTSFRAHEDVVHDGHLFFDRIFDDGEEVNNIPFGVDINLLRDSRNIDINASSSHTRNYFTTTEEPSSYYQEYYGERGFSTDFERAFKQAFDFPFVHQVDVFSPPEWAKNAIWYQIFPERFDNGDPSINPVGVEKWGDVPTEHNFFGGDFQGIINRVPHLVELGITAIYLTPIFKANSNHKYDTTDYFEVDPQFGNKEVLKKLVEVLHQNNIKVVFDAVFNHTGELFEPFLDLKREQENSKFKDWFFVRSFPISYDPIPSYDCFGFHAYMPKLNTANPEVKKFIFEVIRYWTVEFNIDGWRLDVSNEIDHCFWREFRSFLKSLNPEALIIGEVWFNSSKWLLGDQFDSAMNYPLQKSVIDFFCSNTINAVEFCEAITSCRYWYPENVNEVLFNILDSHDTPRILTLCRDNVELMKTTMLFHIFSTGTPCIYYGDEIGMTGENDPECRKCMEWDDTKHNKDLFQFLKHLISIRKEHHSFFCGKASEVVYSNADYNYCLFLRQNETTKLFTLINNCDKEIPFSESIFPWFFHKNSLFSSREVTDLITKKNINSMTTIKPHESFVFFV